MEKPRKPVAKFLLLGFLVLVIGVLAACNTNAPIPEPENTEQPKNEISLPVVGSEMEVDAQEDPTPEVTAYPEPVAESQETTSTQMEAYPAPTEEPVTEESKPMEPKPTSRGSDLFSTAPSTVALASGKVQLVEFFAFW